MLSAGSPEPLLFTFSHGPAQYTDDIKKFLPVNEKITSSDIRPQKNICVFQVSRTYLGFCPDPKHFIVNCEQNVVKSAEKWGKMYWKMQFLYKIFWQNKMLCLPTIPSFFSAETWNTHIFFLALHPNKSDVFSFSLFLNFYQPEE